MVCIFVVFAFPRQSALPASIVSLPRTPATLALRYADDSCPAIVSLQDPLGGDIPANDARAKFNGASASESDDDDDDEGPLVRRTTRSGRKTGAASYKEPVEDDDEDAEDSDDVRRPKSKSRRSGVSRTMNDVSQSGGSQLLSVF